MCKQQFTPVVDWGEAHVQLFYIQYNCNKLFSLFFWLYARLNDLIVCVVCNIVTLYIVTPSQCVFCLANSQNLSHIMPILRLMNQLIIQLSSYVLKTTVVE